MSPLLAWRINISRISRLLRNTPCNYEGASTLYGPASGPVIAARLGYLVAQMAALTTPPALPSQWIFRPGLKVQTFPEVLSMQGDARRSESHWITVPRLPREFCLAGSESWNDLV